MKIVVNNPDSSDSGRNKSKNASPKPTKKIKRSRRFKRTDDTSAQDIESQTRKCKAEEDREVTDVDADILDAEENSGIVSQKRRVDRTGQRKSPGVSSKKSSKKKYPSMSEFTPPKDLIDEDTGDSDRDVNPADETDSQISSKATPGVAEQVSNPEQEAGSAVSDYTDDVSTEDDVDVSSDSPEDTSILDSDEEVEEQPDEKGLSLKSHRQKKQMRSNKSAKPEGSKKKTKSKSKSKSKPSKDVDFEEDVDEDGSLEDLGIDSTSGGSKLYAIVTVTEVLIAGAIFAVIGNQVGSILISHIVTRVMGG